MPNFYFTETKPRLDPTAPLGTTAPLWELSATESINVTSEGVVTSSPIEDGSSLVDNFYLDNRKVTFNGLITKIKSGSFGQEESTVEDWISEVKALRKRKALLTVVADTEAIPNCLIISFDLDKTQQQGLSGWKCKMVFQEVDISERARLVEIKEPKPEVKNDVESKKNNSNVPTQWVSFSETTPQFIKSQGSELLNPTPETTP